MRAKRSNLTTSPEQAQPPLHAYTTSAAVDLPHALFIGLGQLSSVVSIPP